jgi:hypothetical protein
MFIAKPDKSELRQGDIITGVWFPRIRFEDIRLLAAVDSANPEQIVTLPELVSDRGMEWTTAQIQMARRFVMVLSQCCDLEMVKNRPRGLAAVVSPLVPVPEMYRKKPEYLASLRQNKIESYVNHFYVEHAPPLPSDFIVDFGRVVSIGLDQVKDLLSQKVLQLTDASRIALKSKLAFNFGRLTDEEEAAGYKLAMPSTKPPEDQAKPQSEAPGAPAPAEKGDKSEQFTKTPSADAPGPKADDKGSQ